MSKRPVRRTTICIRYIGSLDRIAQLYAKTDYSLLLLNFIPADEPKYDKKVQKNTTRSRETSGGAGQRAVRSFGNIHHIVPHEGWRTIDASS